MINENNFNLNLKELILDNTTILKPFNCDDEDLYNFLVEKAQPYYQELLATTTLLEDDEKTVAYYSIFTDSIKIEEIPFPSNSALAKFLKKLVSHPKRHLKHFSAIKIGRLAVANDAQKLGLGTKIISDIVQYVIDMNEKCACKFIIIDAYKDAVEFYRKLNFEYFSENDSNAETRAMYLDLTPLIHAKRGK